MLRINKYGLFRVRKVLIDKVIEEVEFHRFDEVRICTLSEIYNVTIDAIILWDKKGYNKDIVASK